MNLAGKYKKDERNTGRTKLASYNYITSLYNEDKKRDGFQTSDGRHSSVEKARKLVVGHWTNGNPTIKLTLKKPSPSVLNVGSDGLLVLKLEVNQMCESRTLLLLMFN
jgi:hypothetical protein